MEDDRQVMLRNNIPPRTSQLPNWYYDAWVVSQISWCLIAVINQDDKNNTFSLHEVNSIMGIANEVAGRKFGHYHWRKKCLIN